MERHAWFPCFEEFFITIFSSLHVLSSFISMSFISMDSITFFFSITFCSFWDSIWISTSIVPIIYYGRTPQQRSFLFVEFLSVLWGDINLMIEKDHWTSCLSPSSDCRLLKANTWSVQKHQHGLCYTFLLSSNAWYVLGTCLFMIPRQMNECN